MYQDVREETGGISQEKIERFLSHRMLELSYISVVKILFILLSCIHFKFMYIQKMFNLAKTFFLHLKFFRQWFHFFTCIHFRLIYILFKRFLISLSFVIFHHF